MTDEDKQLAAWVKYLTAGGSNPALERAHAQSANPTAEEFGLLGLLSEDCNDE